MLTLFAIRAVSLLKLMSIRLELSLSAKWATNHEICTGIVYDLKELSGLIYEAHTKLYFAVPKALKDLKDHINDYYFCMTNISGCSKTKTKQISCTNLKSATRHVGYSESLAIPQLTFLFIRGNFITIV